MWVPFNEGWGQHETEKYVAWLKQRDPSRLVNNTSGWTDTGVGDVSDVHSYPGPAMPLLEEKRAAVLGEFGGLGLPLEGHTWIDKGNWGYRTYKNTDELGQAYRDLMYQLRIMVGEGLAAAIYTQTTDVEIEVNGMMTYDRAVVKLPQDARRPSCRARLAAASSATSFSHRIAPRSSGDTRPLLRRRPGRQPRSMTEDGRGATGDSASLIRRVHASGRRG